MPEITDTERRALESFRDLEISLEELGRLLRQRFSFDFTPSSGPYTRSLEKQTDPAEPGVPVRREHLVHAYERWKAAEVDSYHLAHWASMLVMNDDYQLDENEQELISEWLNTLSVDGVMTNPSPQ